jgi:hypothetical protein
MSFFIRVHPCPSVANCLSSEGVRFWEWDCFVNEVTMQKLALFVIYAVTGSSSQRLFITIHHILANSWITLEPAILSDIGIGTVW